MRRRLGKLVRFLMKGKMMRMISESEGGEMRPSFLTSRHGSMWSQLIRPGLVLSWTVGSLEPLAAPRSGEGASPPAPSVSRSWG